MKKVLLGGVVSAAVAVAAIADTVHTTPEKPLVRSPFRGYRAARFGGWFVTRRQGHGWRQRRQVLHRRVR
jgi:hypothetical protein